MHECNISMHVNYKTEQELKCANENFSIWLLYVDTWPSQVYISPFLSNVFLVMCLFFPPSFPRAITFDFFSLHSCMRTCFVRDKLYFLTVQFIVPYNVLENPKQFLWGETGNNATAPLFIYFLRGWGVVFMEFTVW